MLILKKKKITREEFQKEYSKALNEKYFFFLDIASLDNVEFFEDDKPTIAITTNKFAEQEEVHCKQNINSDTLFHLAKVTSVIENDREGKCYLIKFINGDTVGMEFRTTAKQLSKKSNTQTL